MDRSKIIYLLRESYEPNEYGVLIRKLERRKVYADVSSVTAQEFFNGGLNGLKPELRMTVFFADYKGENIIEYQGTQYTVYRTYQERNDQVELYCELRKGNE
jgi:SPP1 family predicted phage head-tail adaptor